MFTLHLIHMVLQVETLLRVMSVLRILDQVCLKFTYRPLLREVMFTLLEVMLLLPEHIFLLPERIFLLTECLMGHFMG